MWKVNGERGKVKRKVEVKAKVKGEAEVKENEILWL
jgi:hypothetical protein